MLAEHGCPDVRNHVEARGNESQIMSSEFHRIAKYKAFLKRFAISAVVLAVIVAFTLSPSETVHASLLSFISSVIEGQPVSADVSVTPSFVDSRPDILALRAPANPNPVPDNATGTPPITGGNALSPEMAAQAASEAGPDSTSISTYVVQPDDTLSGISLMFGVSVSTIEQANGMANDRIRPGQSLTILPVDGVLYKVRSGDTLGGIAEKFNASEDDILTYNDITDSSLIIPGDKLIIPHGELSAVKARSYLSYVAAREKVRVPSFEPLLDPVWDWPAAPAGYYECPVPGSVLTQGLHGHNAVDLAVPYGTPIHAAAAGEVIVSKDNGYWNGGYGNFVMISHDNGSETLYAHMERTAASTGQHVAKGQVIGYVGMTGMTTGPHVHFEIRGAVNPFVDPDLCR